MIYISTAMYCEAKPIISYLGLKKDMDLTKFEVFKNDKVTLIITKIGMISSAIATTFLLTEKKVKKYDTYINIGVCGSKNKDLKEGNVILCNKIINHSSKKTFYTDMIFKHPFIERSLETFSTIVTEDMQSQVEGDLADMEGAADYQAASVFLPPHQIYCIKIVCDFLEDNKVTGKNVEYLIQNKVDILLNWILKRSKLYEKQEDILTKKEYENIKQVKDNLKITTSMYYQLIQLVKQYKLREGNIKEVLKDFEEIQCKCKKEGKVYFGKLKNKLITA